MSTSLLYHGFGVHGYEYRSTEYAKDRLTLTIAEPRETLCFSQCGSRKVHAKGA